VLFQARNQFIDLRHVSGDTGLHQRFDRRDEEMNNGLFRATEAGTVTACKRQVGVLVQQYGLECADAFLQVIDADVFLRCVRQIEPELPVLSERPDRFGRLRDRSQSIVIADLHAFHAAFAGIRIDRDTQEAAVAFLLLFRQREIRAAKRELKIAEFLTKIVEFGAELFLVAIGQIGIGDRLLDRFLDEARYGCGFFGVGKQLLELALHPAYGTRQLFGFLALFPESRDDRIEHLADFVDQARYRGVGTDGVAVAAAGAVLGNELRMLEADRCHVPEMRGDRRHQAHAHERIGRDRVACAPGVTAAGLRPEAMDVRRRRGRLGLAFHHDGNR
jgi:hypothetical protein